MKTTLSKLSVFILLLLVVSCARKSAVYSDIFSTKFINESFHHDLIAEKSEVINKQIADIGSNFGSFTNNRTASFSNSNGVSASAYASVTIIDPAALYQSEELVFGKISLKNLKNKFVSFNEIGSSYQRLLLPNLYSNAAQKMAEFSVEGGVYRALDITIPKQISLYHQNGNDELTAFIQTKNSSNKNDNLNNFKFTIDSKVHFNALSVPGYYSSKDFAVTVNYN